MKPHIAVAVIALAACKKQEASSPAPQMKLIDAAVVADAAPIDGPIDAAIDAPADAGERCKPDECYFEERKRCVVPTGQVGNAACGRRSKTDDRCSICRCAAPWTPIDTPQGARPIAELRTGDLVYSLDGTRIVTVPITRTNRVEVSGHRVSEVIFDDGSRLMISSEHPLADGRELGSVVTGDVLGARRVVASRLVDYPFDATYDILPASTSGVYFSRGVPLGSTLR